MVLDLRVRYDFAMLADVFEIWPWITWQETDYLTALDVKRWWSEPSEPF